MHRMRSASALAGARCAWRRPASVLQLPAPAAGGSGQSAQLSSNASSSCASARQYISLYNYTSLDECELPRLRRRMLAVWKRMDVLGRIYISQEGVNAQLVLPETKVPALTASFPALLA
ncbi:hypothetical protein Gpo141_00013270, partial [Globisporangium polare]